MRSLRVAGALLLVAAVFVSIFCYWRYGESRDRVAAVARQVQEQKSRVADNPKTATLNTIRSQALGSGLITSNSVGVENSVASAPPENMPLSSIAQTLRRQADSGDAYSACRLAMELMRCALYERYEVPRMEKIAKPSTTDSQSLGYSSKQIEQIQRKYWTNSNVCQGFKNEEALSADLYILRAALLGHSGAMQFVATSPSLELAGESATFDAFVSRREYSSMFLQQLAEAGNLPALIELAEQHSGRSWWNQVSRFGSQATSHEDAAVFALAADIRQNQQLAINPKLNPASIFRFLNLETKLSKPEIQRAQQKAEQLAKGFPSLEPAPSARSKELKEQFPDADPKVLMCRE